MAEFLPAQTIQRYAFFQYPAAARTVSDGATNSNTTVTSATAAFTSLDVGAGISGGSIPGGATISSVTNATTVVISGAATTTATSVSITITRTNANAITAFQNVYQAGVSALATVQALATTAAPTVAVVITPSSGPVLSVSPTQWLGYNYGTWQIVPNASMGRTVTDAATTNASTTVTSATASFVAGDVGGVISTANLPVNTTIVSVTNSTTVVVSAQATATGSSQAATIVPTTSLYVPDVV